MATSYLAEQDTDTPLARWRMEETSGTTLTDDVGSVVATITGTVTPGSTLPTNIPAAGVGADFAGGAASMTGVTAWRPQTIEAIVTFDTKPSTSSTLRPWVFGHDLAVGTDPLPLVLGFNLNGSAQGRLGVGYWSGTAWRVVHAGSANITTGHRTHVVGVYDGSTNLKIYIDGVQAGSATVTARGTQTGVSGTAWIGQRSDASAQIDGVLWDLALYNGGLSAGRVTAHYDASIQPGSLAISGGGGMGFEGEEALALGAAWGPLRGGGQIKLRATNLEATRPAVVHFAPHPNDIAR